jgi:hypothetical protein
MRLFVLVTAIGACMLTSTGILAQNYKWYILQSVAPLNEENSKSFIVALKEFLPEAEIWYNTGESKTLGCKYQYSIDWPGILSSLHNGGIFLADMTDGQVHKSGGEASTTIWYVQALYYSSHPDERPLGYIAKLNQAEWDALPEDVRNLYLSKGDYAIITE